MKYLTCFTLLICLCGIATAEEPRQNRAPLAPVPYLPLPLGSVQADGWLRTQLELQRDGLTGHLPELFEEVSGKSGWLGGDGENWEKGPYYIKGLIALAYTLDNDELKNRVQPWIEWSLQSQREDGFFGPASNDDWWPRMVMTHVLREHAEATGDARVEPFLSKYYDHMAKHLPERPLREWGRARAADEIETVLWLYNRSGDASLLSVAQLLHDQAYPWTDIFTNNGFYRQPNDFHTRHNVNVPQALKMPAFWYLLSKSDRDKSAIDRGLEHLRRDHGVSFGMNAGSEMLAGSSSTQGVETCSTVERMLSNQSIIRIFGDPRMGDNLETLAFNLLPAALTHDIKQHVYYSLPNNVRADIAPHAFYQDYDNGTTPAAPSGFPCCVYNLHMGWPKFVQNSWAATDDGGLAAITYGPNHVTTKVAGGTRVTIQQTTDYPFDDAIALTMDVERPTEFPLVLRIPDWCEAPKVAVNGNAEGGIAPGTFHRISRLWQTGDRVEIKFPMTVRLQSGVNESLSVFRGPLLYSLKIDETFAVGREGKNGFDLLTVNTDDPWNFGLAVDPKTADGFEFRSTDMPGNPFDPSVTPSHLSVHAKSLPQWQWAYDGQVALDPPISPTDSDQPLTKIELVPAGSQMLRITSFPWIGKSVTPPKEVRPDFSKEGLSRWISYGGNWYVDDNELRAAPAGPAKIVANHTRFSDLVYEADVRVGEGGDAGLMLRVHRASLGTDQYQGYYVGIDATNAQIVAGKSDGRWQPIVTAPVEIKAGGRYHVRVEAVGTTFKVYLDEKTEPVLMFEDASFQDGSIGLRTYFSRGDQVDCGFSSVSAKGL